MDCEHCTEYLADFLLDELPESEAVLIQEHLNLCPGCMRTYKELKGTGKMLEAVPAMRTVQGSAEFDRAVRAGATVESAKIIEALPAEKRLRVEARRAARAARSSQRTSVRYMSRAWGLVVAVIIGVTAICLIFFAGNGAFTPRTQIGTLALSSGQVEAGSRENRSAGPAHEGQNIYIGDRIATSDGARARVELNDGTTLFVGPSSSVTLQPQSSTVDAFSVMVDNGGLGVNRPARTGDKDTPRTLLKWDVQSELGLLLPDPGAQLYVTVEHNGREFSGNALVVAGSTTIVSRTEGTEVTSTLNAGSRYLQGTGAGKGRTETADGARVPAWRVEMVSEADLQRMLNGRVKIVKRTGAGLEVELLYGRDTRKVSDDWIADPAANGALAQQADDAISVPTARLVHVIPFEAPLYLVLTINRDVRAERNLAFGALYTPERGISADIAREAALQVRIKSAHAHRAVVAAHKEPGKTERLALEIAAEKGGFAATLSSQSEKTSAVTLPPEFQGKTGQLWIQALSEGLKLDEVKISGTIPAEWLSESLSKAK
jgi:hypothetical protein